LWLAGGKPGRWTQEDLLLTLAQQQYEDGLCAGCGEPRDAAYHGARGNGYYDRKTLSCAGCAALGAKHDGKPSPGDKDYLVWVDRS